MVHVDLKFIFKHTLRSVLRGISVSSFFLLNNLDQYLKGRRMLSFISELVGLQWMQPTFFTIRLKYHSCFKLLHKSQINLETQVSV